MLPKSSLRNSSLCETSNNNFESGSSELAIDESNSSVQRRKQSDSSKASCSNEETFVALVEQQTLNKKYKQDIELLTQELQMAKETIAKLRKNETKLREKCDEQAKEIESLMNRQQQQQNLTTATSNGNYTLNNSIAAESLIGGVHSTSSHDSMRLSLDLVRLYSNLNTQYRLEAFESLDSLDAFKELPNADEFKLKLLFSVIVVIEYII